MSLRILTHAERDLRDTMPDLWPAFIAHDPVVSSFWPRLYELYADFQLWVVDGKKTVAYACTLPVHWDGVPEERGLDWAMSNGAAGEPTTLCAVVAGKLELIAVGKLLRTQLRGVKGRRQDLRVTLALFGTHGLHIAREDHGFIQWLGYRVLCAKACVVDHHQTCDG